MWKSNNSSVTELSDKVDAVLDDQAESGQILNMTETVAGKRFPDLVVASLGIFFRKDKPGGVDTAGVFSTAPLASTRVRGHAIRSKPRLHRTTTCYTKKSAIGEPTFTLTADAPGLPLSWLSSHSKFRCVCSYGRDFRSGLGVVSHSTHMASRRGRRLPYRDPRNRNALLVIFVLCETCTTVVVENSRVRSRCLCRV